MKTDSNLLKIAIEDYVSDCQKYMVLLGNHFGYDINKEIEFQELISRSNKNVPRKGFISERINYSFHGGDCSFYNKKHKLTIDVDLSNPPFFDKINHWFLMKYLESNHKYKELSEQIGSWLNLKTILEQPD